MADFHPIPSKERKFSIKNPNQQSNNHIDYPHIVQKVVCFSIGCQISPIGAAPFIEMQGISSKPRSGGTNLPVKRAWANAPCDLNPAFL